MSSWTFNVSDAKKNLMEQIDTKYKAYENQNYMNHELDIIKPIVETVLKAYPDTHDDSLVEVTVSKGDMGGVTAVNLNVLLH
jgi:hypothetical protein